ncbi:MAG: ABC transporter permease [Chloroflexi bacterium]|nr:ABC transporter permease [Chloroflexota bacterium]
MTDGVLVNELEEIAPGGGQDKVYVATQWQLMWWKFRRHKMAIVGGFILIGLYLITIFCEFLAPYDPHRYDVKFAYAQPQRVHFYGQNGLGLYAYGLVGHRDPESLRMVFEVDRSVEVPLRFLVQGDPYKLWGLIPGTLHLFGAASNDQVVFVLGADRLGRDLLSRLLVGTRVSMTIGLVGVLMSMVFGILIGGSSGYFSGVYDTVVQRIIEFIRSIPSIPLWMALSAAVPKDWPPVRVYFSITIILSFISWTGLARVVRGKFLSLREEDFVMSARLVGSSEFRIIVRHMVPSFLSHIIASLTLSIPGMILSETSLSFLGLGIRPPAISWGVLLQDAQNLRSVALAPWLLIPGIAVVLAVLAYNFLGDGLRDAADPYSR